MKKQFRMQIRKRRQKHPSQSRRGAVIIAVLVTFGVVALLLLAAAKLSMGQSRQLKRELQMQQTRLLVDAGVAMAIRKHRGGGKQEPDAWREASVDVTGYEKSTVKWRVDSNDLLEVVATVGDPQRVEQQTTYSIKLQAQDWNSGEKK